MWLLRKQAYELYSCVAHILRIRCNKSHPANSRCSTGFLRWVPLKHRLYARLPGGGAARRGGETRLAARRAPQSDVLVAIGTLQAAF